MGRRKGGSRALSVPAEHPPAADGEATEMIDCRRAPLTFGRSRACGVVLDAPAVQPRHAALFATGDRFELLDQSASAGTIVNAKAIGRARLTDGDQVQLGPYLFYFHNPYLVWARPPAPVTLTADRIEQV